MKLPIVFLLLFAVSPFAVSAPTCPTTLPSVTLGTSGGSVGAGASFLMDVKLEKTFLNNAKDIALCQYRGKRCSQGVGGPTKCEGTYRLDKFSNSKDYTKNNSKLGWNARLFGYDKNNNKIFFCSATVVSPYWILTVKECVNRGKNLTKHYVVGNVANDSDDDNSKSQEANVDWANRKTNDSDLMLLRMDSTRPMILSRYPALQPGDDKHDLEGKSAVIYGWGCNGESYCKGKGKSIHELNRRSAYEHDDYLSESSISFMSSTQNKFYDGDEGGACLYTDRNGGDFLAGVVHWTKGYDSKQANCRLAIHPYYNWINGVIKLNK